MLGIYLIKSGTLAFVLMSHNNAIYSKQSSGSIIGFEDFPYALH